MNNPSLRPLVGDPRPSARKRAVVRIMVVTVLLGAVLGVVSTPLWAQTSPRIGGLVVDASTGVPVADVTIRIEGTILSAVTNAEGRFVINDVPRGVLRLRFDHLAYGTHTQSFEVDSGASMVQVRLSTEAIELEAIEVVGRTTVEEQRRRRGSSQWVVDRDEIVEALGTSRHLGDLIRQTIPGVRLRQSNSTVGSDVCIEFRAAATLSIANNMPCNSPLVYVDGVPTVDPTSLYGALPLETLEEIEMLPPGEAGARYGTGALYGVMLITTRRPNSVRGTAVDPRARSLSNFDWALDPAGHNTKRALFSALVGSAVGLTLGVVAARQCIGIDAKDEIVTTCSGPRTAAAGTAALILPALGGAFATRWGGGTATSEGRWVPAAASALLVLVPGYAFALSTQGGGESDIANAVGGTLLVVGVPALLTVADRLFRELR